MNQQKSNYPTHHRQRVLETTLAAVKDRQKNQRKTRYAMTGALTIAVLAGVFFTLNKIGVEDTNPTRLTSRDQDTHTTPHPGHPPLREVSIASAGEVRTLLMSSEDLARMVYDPSLKLTSHHNALVWSRGDYTVIQTPMPNTLMAITESLPTEGNGDSL